MCVGMGFLGGFGVGGFLLGGHVGGFVCIALNFQSVSKKTT